MPELMLINTVEVGAKPVLGFKPGLCGSYRHLVVIEISSNHSDGCTGALQQIQVFLKLVCLIIVYTVYIFCLFIATDSKNLSTPGQLKSQRQIRTVNLFCELCQLVY